MRVLGLVVSTGRCGTLSLSRYLQTLAPPAARVFHEKISQLQTQPNRFFRAYEPARQEEQLRDPQVAEFIDQLEGLGEEVRFVDTGWTLYPLVPLLVKRYGAAVRVLHLVRHPVLTTTSLWAHGLYDRRRKEDYPEDYGSHLRPWAPGVFRPQVAEHWARMSGFERNLFRSAEITSFGLELPERFPDLAYMRVKLEEVDSEVNERLLRFFDWPVPKTIEQWPKANPTDPITRGARAVTGREWRRFFDYPWACDQARQLGYSLDEQELARQMRKYRPQGAREWAAFVAYRIPWARMLARRFRARLRLERPPR